MIVVIADDISGAAELAGAASQLGFSAEVQTEFDPASDLDVVAIDTDTRSTTSAQAAETVARVASQVVMRRPDWIYKKVDSVLRGHIRIELEAILKVTGQKGALLIPANPSKGRIIRNGRYYVEGQLLTETTFGRDPLFPARTSDVATRLSEGGSAPVRNIAVEERGSGEGITIPDVTERSHLIRRAEEVRSSILPGGGVDFFIQILARDPCTLRQNLTSPMRSQGNMGRTLFVCGSAAAWETGRDVQCRSKGVPMECMPSELFTSEKVEPALSKWTGSARRSMEREASVMLALGRPTQASADPERLARRLVEVAARLLDKLTVDLVCLEGGATASAFLRRMSWSRLRAETDRGWGMPAFRPLEAPDSPLLFIKPGSYNWPEAIWPHK